jgi:hypothetical protein
MSSCAYIFSLFMIFVSSFFFKLILTRRPNYLFVDVHGAGSVRTSNFIFPLVCPSAWVLVRGIRLWNHLPLPIKDSRSVAAFESTVWINFCDEASLN